ncbi:hypothetical protein DVH24_026010 [Malus domestica]|uniref:Uncharacterized protein n=1 Tax=Malus domestica TaxID=3750 RepID=A0A498KKA8_MALDO|nr:hypothetical protein DVH24_026010 [Malus domestica]
MRRTHDAGECNLLLSAAFGLHNAGYFPHPSIHVDYSSATTTNKTPSPPSPPKLPIIRNLHQLGLALSCFYTLEAAREITKIRDLTFSGRPNSTIFKKLLNTTAPGLHFSVWNIKSICVFSFCERRGNKIYGQQHEAIVVISFEFKQNVYETN